MDRTGPANVEKAKVENLCHEGTVDIMTWVTQDGTWINNIHTEHTEGVAATVAAQFSPLTPGSSMLLFVRAITEARPDGQEMCKAKAVQALVYKFKRAWTGAGAPTSEDFKFLVGYSPDWTLAVLAPEGGEATAGGTIKVVIRSGGKGAKTYPMAVNQPISAPPDQNEQRKPRPATGLQIVFAESPKFPHSADLDFEVEIEVTSESEAAKPGARATALLMVNNCVVT